jgi:hypothetical protein
MPSRRLILLGLPALAACGVSDPVRAPEAEIAAARYRHPGPPVLSLYTSRNNGSNAGAHSALMISASERVIFDPAGSFKATGVPERDDVLFGITPGVQAVYEDFQGSGGYHAIRQDIPVSAEMAEQALTLALAHGPAPKATCTRATSGVLRRLPGMEHLRSVLLPENLMEQVQFLPGVTATLIFQDPAGDRGPAEAAFQRLVRGETRLTR